MDMDERLAELERRLNEAERGREDAEHKLEDAEHKLEDAEHKLEDAERKLDDAEAQTQPTTWFEFLTLCHNLVYMKIRVQTNPLLASTGAVANVTGKCYPRYLRPWKEFNQLHEEMFKNLEGILGQQRLMPSSMGLEMQARRVKRGRKLASEEDLKRFALLALEGCVDDALDRLLVPGEAGDEGAPPIYAQILPMVRDISFHSYPYGVVSTDSDEEEQELALQAQSFTADFQAVPSGGQEGQRQQGEQGTQPQGQNRNQNSRSASSKTKLNIRDDRPAYLGALAIAKRDIDAAQERAEEEKERRETSQSRPKKRMSPERTKLHPDLWCFRHNDDDSMVPLFVIEYKAAHKVDNEALRNVLRSTRAETLMEDSIRSINGKRISKEPPANEVDIAKILTQAFDYMVDYGLQYGYVSTGLSLVFLFLDPTEPTTVYYHLEQPKTDVMSTDRAGLKHTAVALIMTFVHLSLGGEYMKQSWKKQAKEDLRRWPDPYDDMAGASSGSASDEGGKPTGPPNLVALSAQTMLPPGGTHAGQTSCRDTAKDPNKRRHMGDDSDGEDNGSGGGDSTYQGRRTHSAGTDSRRNTRSTARKGEQPETQDDGMAACQVGPPTQATQLVPAWTFSADTVLTPTLPYCSQACLLGLKHGGPLDPRCPNYSLHRQMNPQDGYANPTTKKHPISATEFCSKLVEQLGRTMDEDCHSLERYGMFGATGALFKVALRAYGYCIVAKGVQRPHRPRLDLEALAYARLEACQGALVPVYLGIIDLQDEYHNMFGAHFAHMMVLSYCGASLWHVHRGIQQQAAARQRQTTGDGSADGEAEAQTKMLLEEQQRTLTEIAPYGIDHGDIRPENLVWNEDLGRVMVIDFDRAVLRDALEAEKRRERQREKERVRKRRLATDGSGLPATKRRAEVKAE
ncbi:hypothetical protein BT67DRAFT_443530 [Trichocladium antarcticum]|uniref:Protein kinase domain-containing protein n=1 Tax=Trichocladium antarcticum TaxID=1450529 RepID=A0AAN6UHI5_9PEZI|nr:hypothetical protein BT67DRAFT_443530 [Trichocladium antarcticum]